MECRAKRMTLEDIGKLIGVTRQRVWSIVNNYQQKQKLKPIEDLKTLTKRKREFLGIDVVNGIDLRDSNRAREIVRHRDNYTCQICLKKSDKWGKKFDVHHLDKEYENNKTTAKQDMLLIDRMITLCHKCHMKLKNSK